MPYCLLRESHIQQEQDGRNQEEDEVHQGRDGSALCNHLQVWECHQRGRKHLKGGEFHLRKKQSKKKHSFHISIISVTITNSQITIHRDQKLSRLTVASATTARRCTPLRWSWRQPLTSWTRPLGSSRRRTLSTWRSIQNPSTPFSFFCNEAKCKSCSPQLWSVRIQDWEQPKTQWLPGSKNVKGLPDLCCFNRLHEM